MNVSGHQKVLYIKTNLLCDYYEAQKWKFPRTEDIYSTTNRHIFSSDVTWGCYTDHCTQKWAHIFVESTVSRTVLGPIQPPIHWVPGALSLAVKRPRREADHSLPSSARVKNA